MAVRYTHDAYGNPTIYYNGTRWTMNWQEGNGLRVRNWLAGKPFDYQYSFGIDIIEKYWRDLYDK